MRNTAVGICGFSAGLGALVPRLSPGVWVEAHRSPWAALRALDVQGFLSRTGMGKCETAPSSAAGTVNKPLCWQGKGSELHSWVCS